MDQSTTPYSVTITETQQADGSFEMYFFWTAEPTIDDYRIDIYSLNGKLEALATTGKQPFAVIKNIKPGYKKITLSARKNGVWKEVYSKNYVTPNWNSPVPQVTNVPFATPLPSIETTFNNILFQAKLFYGVLAVGIVLYYVSYRIQKKKKKL